MQDYKLVIFDWDGTLMNSVDRIVSSMQTGAKHCQLNVPSVQEVKNIIGLSLPTALECLFPKASEKQRQLMVEQYKYQYIKGDNTPTPLFEHALKLLTNLKKANKILAVATGKGRQGLQRVLTETKTLDFFEGTRCADEAKSKPDPDMIISLLEELDICPTQAVMIGDTSHDMKMAQSAGVDRIGVTLGAHNRSILNQFDPKAVVDSLSELEAILITK